MTVSESDTSVVPTEQPVRPTVPSSFEPRKAKPVKWWAAVGAAFLALEVYVVSSWLLSGNVTRTPIGPDKVPSWMVFSVRAQEIGGFIVALGVIYWFLIRPWRREGRLTLDDMFVICFILIYWQDPFLNYTQYVGTYNTALFNLGSWVGNVPGWNSPNGHTFPEPLFWGGPAYVWAIFGGIVIANRIMRRVQARRPRLGTAGLIGAYVALFMVADLVLEVVFLRTGVYFYGGAMKEFTVFHGHYYQFPVYEVVLFGWSWAAWACVRHFRDDRGRTVAERGIDEVRATPKQKAGLRLLALIGITNVIFLWCNIGWQWFGLHSDPWPNDISRRSYMNDGLCGSGTAYACPGPDVPINRPNSAYVTTGGRLAPPR